MRYSVLIALAGAWLASVSLHVVHACDEQGGSAPPVVDIASLPVLCLGEGLSGVIEESDPTVATSVLEVDYAGDLMRGKSYRIEVMKTGPHYIELRSHFFDAYLVLRDQAGAVLAEDDDGLVLMHARLTLPSIEKGKLYRLDACALHGGTGAFELRLNEGKPNAIPASEKSAADLREARRSAHIVEATRGPDHPSTASSLNNLALLLHAQGDYEAAGPLFERVLEICEAVFGPNHPSTATSLSNLALLREAQGDYKDARPLYERELSILEAALGSDHPDTATSVRKLALLLQVQGDYEGARPLFERALSITDATLGPDHRDTAVCLNDLGLLLHAQGDYEGARPHFERALGINEAALGPVHPSTAACLHNLALLFKAQGDYEAARPYCERAHSIFEAALGPDHPDIARSLGSLAGLLYRQGDYEGARPLYERAVEITEAALGPTHPDTALSLHNLALLLKAQGNYDGARLLFERALSIQSAALGDHPWTATSLSSLALLLYYQRDYEGARPYCERALSIQEAALGPDHPDTASSLNVLALLLHVQGDYEGARSRFERALLIRDAALGPNHPSTATSLNNLAWLLRAQGDYEGARLHNERALSIHESAFGPDHPDTASSLNHLALLLVDLGMLGEAATLSDRAIQGSEAQRRRVAWALAESERLLLSRKQRVALDLFLSIARLQSSDAARDAYDNILRWKAHVLRSLVQSRGRVLAGLSEADQGRVASLRQLQGRLSRELFRKNIEDREAHQELLANLRARRQAIERELNRSLGSVEDEDPVSASKLGQALPAGAVLVDFLVHRVYVPARREGERVVEEGRWAEPRLSAWIVHPGATGALRWIDLGDAAPIETAVRRFLDEMIASRGVSRVAEHSPESQQAPVSANDELRHLLWEPLSEFVGDSKRVFVSPDGFLGTLPFETIQLADGTYLIERMSFVYLENGDAIVDIAQAVETEAVPDLLCVGDVNYRRKSDLAWRSAAGSQDDLVEHEAPFENASELSMATRAAPTNLFARADVRGGFLKPWATLRATAEETEAILEAHDDRYKGTDARRLRLTGRDATEERVKRELARHDIVHIATHGFFQPEGLPSMWRRVAADEGGVRMEMLEEERRIVGLMPGLLSGLVLAGANKIPEEGRDDGLLTAEEISMLDLSDVDLVVLSACETALGKAEAGEGMLGLRRMFRQAGARTVVSSLWKVGDHATSELMQIFYDRMWSRDESPAAALRGAQLDKLKQNRIENNGDGLPSTWGAFVLDGAW